MIFQGKIHRHQYTVGQSRTCFFLVFLDAINTSMTNPQSPGLEQFRWAYMMLIQYDLISCSSPVNEALIAPLTSSSLHFWLTQWTWVLFLTNIDQRAGCERSILTYITARWEGCHIPPAHNNSSDRRGKEKKPKTLLGLKKHGHASALHGIGIRDGLCCFVWNKVWKMSQLGSTRCCQMPEILLISQQQDVNFASVDCCRINNNMKMTYEAAYWSSTAPTAGRFAKHQRDEREQQQQQQ